MNRKGLIEALKTETGLSYREAKAVVAGFFDFITEALSNGDRVEIRGFCSFQVKKYRAYTGRNPRTGEVVKVGRKKLPFFRAGKDLQNKVDGAVVG